MNWQNTENHQRCESLSRLMQAYCLTFAIGGLIFTSWLIVKSVSDGPGIPAVLAALALLWVLGIAMQVTNWRLVSCGTQPERFRLSPRFVNRPDLGVRIAYHILVNWGVVIVTVIAAFSIRPSDSSIYLAYVCLAATVATWVAFNILHRRINRAKNLIFTSVVAGSLLFFSIRLVLQEIN
jgi:hypothetical protein